MNPPPPSSRASLPTRPVRDDDPFEYAGLEGLLERALRDVGECRLTERERAGAARLVAFVLTEQLVTEAVTTDVLAALWKAVDVARVVRTLLRGLRHALGDHEKIMEWTRRITGRAHDGRHVESFVSAMRILVTLRDFDGGLPTSWQLSLIRGSEDPRLRRRLLLLSDDYARRFGSEARWVTTVRARYLLGANPHAEPAVSEES